jgi:hypothetical protein
MLMREARNLRYHQWVYHKKWRNSDGSPYGVRVNGKVQTWKTRPNEIRIPIKRGMYEYGYITQSDLDDWTLQPQSRLPKRTERFLK